VPGGDRALLEAITLLKDHPAPVSSSGYGTGTGPNTFARFESDQRDLDRLGQELVRHVVAATDDVDPGDWLRSVV
jgi:hypothetical protein